MPVVKSGEIQVIQENNHHENTAVSAGKISVYAAGLFHFFSERKKHKAFKSDLYMV